MPIHTRNLVIHRPSPKKLLIISAIGVFGLVLFLVIFENYTHHNGLARFDQPVHDWMVSHRTPVWTLVMQAITNLASPALLPIIIVIGAGVWIKYTKQLWRPALLVGSTGLAVIIMAIIKHVVQRGRPPIETMVPPIELGYSFPSGHTIGMAVFLLVLGYLLCSRTRNTRKIIIWASSTVIGTVLVAISRVYLGFHWVTDVSASIALSLFILAIVMAIDSFYRPRPAKTSSKATSDIDQ